MSSETSCPSCGTPLPTSRPTPTISHSMTHCAEAVGPNPLEPREPATISAPLPVPVAIHSDSNTNHDMPTLRDIGPASEPDPLLGEFDPTASTPSRDAASVDGDPDEFEVPASLNASDDQAESPPALLGIDVSPPGASRAARRAPSPSEETVVAPPRRGNLPLVLIGSYASAMTLAVAWLLYDRRAEGPHEPEPPAPPVAVPASRERQGRTVVIDEVPDGRSTTIGRPIRVGSLEIEPIRLERRAIRLLPVAPPLLDGKRAVGRDGGTAWALRLRLKNLSKEESFSPLDETYLRQGERGPVDSFIEAGPEGRVYFYPLAVESEWKIEGQEFRELRPLEGFETMIVSESAPKSEASQLRWRLRLRVSADRSETIAIQTPAP